MSRQSNAYIIIFVIILCVVIGGLLAGASQFLAPAQKKSVDLATKSQILGAVKDLVTLDKNSNVLSVYDQHIKSLVVNYQGEKVSTDESGNPLVAENVDVAKNYKKDPKDRLYPVFKLVDQEAPSRAKAYIFPCYGNGLWDKIWGYIALDANLEEIVGVVFDHKGETPGLGQRIVTDEIQNRYKGKEIFDQGILVSVEMMKGEHGGESIAYYEDQPHKVDGMSGATLTGKGVNEMLKSYLSGYRNFIKKEKASQK